MIDIQDLWTKARDQLKDQPDVLSDDEIKVIINDRLHVVTTNLGTISRHNQNETLFDLMMLVFDSLTEHREAVLNIYGAYDFSSSLICQVQSQCLAAIDQWHETLDLHWTFGRYMQNLLFLCALLYAASVWKEDISPDNSKVMAKIDELISWINSSKSAPFDLLEKIKSKLVV